MNRTNIEWVRNTDGSQGYTWNPITGCRNHDNGLCKGGGFPCYAYKLAHGRLKQRYLNHQIFPVGIFDDEFYRADPITDPFYPRFWEERLNEAYTYGRNFAESGRAHKGIFVCDMGELFGDWIPREWRERIFYVIEYCPQHRFYLLTKQPQNLIKFSPFPENCWVGVTATNAKMVDDAGYYFQKIDAEVRFLSLEPLLEAMQLYFSNLVFNKLDWLIMGACTGSYQDILALHSRYPRLTMMPWGKKWTLQPPVQWLQEIVEAADQAGIPVFLKDNLKPLLPKGSPFYTKPCADINGKDPCYEEPCLSGHDIDQCSKAPGFWRLRQEMPE